MSESLLLLNSVLETLCSSELLNNDSSPNFRILLEKLYKMSN